MNGKLLGITNGHLLVLMFSNRGNIQYVLIESFRLNINTQKQKPRSSLTYTKSYKDFVVEREFSSQLKDE